MAGLLGSVLAGGVKSVADGKIKDIERQEEFDLQNKLLEARIDKEMRLKEAGYEMEDKRAAAQQEKRAGYLKGEDGKDLTTQEAAQKAIQAGDFEAGEGLLKVTPKKETYTLSEGQKVVDAAGNVIAEGAPKERKIDVNDMLLKAAQGDKEAKAFLAQLDEREIKKAKAGRAPRAATETQSKREDFIEANADNPAYVKNGRLTSAGFDKLNKLNDDLGYQTVTEEPALNLANKPIIGENGQPVMARKVTRKEKIPEKPLKPWERKY